MNNRTSLRTVLIGLLTVCLLAVAGAGCYRHGVVAPGAPPPGVPPTFAKWNHHFLFGVVAVDPEIDVSTICAGAPVARIQTYVGPVGFLLGVLTVGVWVPTTTRVWCARVIRGDLAPDVESRPASPGAVVPAARPVQ